MADGLENSRHPQFHSCLSLSLDVKIASLSPPLLHVMDGRTSRADVSPLPWHLSYHTTCAAANGVLPYGKVHSGITSRPERRSRCLSLYLAVISVSLAGETRAGMSYSRRADEVVCVREGTQAAGSVRLKMQVTSLCHGILNGIFAPLRSTMHKQNHSEWMLAKCTDRK